MNIISAVVKNATKMSSCSLSRDFPRWRSWHNEQACSIYQIEIKQTLMTESEREVSYWTTCPVFGIHTGTTYPYTVYANVHRLIITPANIKIDITIIQLGD